MKLPADAEIAPEKLSRYLLVRQARGDKSAFLSRAGYAAANSEQLLSDLAGKCSRKMPSRSNRTNLVSPSKSLPRSPDRMALCFASVPSGLRSTCLGSRNSLRWFPKEDDNVQFELYAEAALARDLAELGLRRGDLVKLVEHHTAPDGDEGYSIEVLNALGETIAVTIVSAAALEPLRNDEILSVRQLAFAQ